MRNYLFGIAEVVERHGDKLALFETLGADLHPDELWEYGYDSGTHRQRLRDRGIRLSDR
jgi:hypothetical protein